MFTQYSLNIFIYAYRSEQYRAAYWDLLVVIFPCLPKLMEELGKQCRKKKRTDGVEIERQHLQNASAVGMSGIMSGVHNPTRTTNA